MASLAVSRSYKGQMVSCRNPYLGTYLVVVAEQLVKKVNSIVAHKTLVIGINKRVPGFLRVPGQNVVILRIQFNVILVQVVEKVLCSQHLRNLDELV